MSSEFDDRESIARVIPLARSAADPAVNPTAAAVLLGMRLRRIREDRDMTVSAAAKLIKVSVSKLSRLERAENPPVWRDVADLARALGVGRDETAEFEKLVGYANKKIWWRQYSDVMPGWATRLYGLEPAATRLRTYEVKVVPGLLQIEDYARAVVRGDLPRAERDEVERRVRLRKERQRRFFVSPAESSVFILDESVLNRRVGSPQVMADQMQALIDAADADHVHVRVVTMDNSVASSVASLTHLMFGSDGPPEMVYLEQHNSAEYHVRGAEAHGSGSREREKHTGLERYLELLLELSIAAAQRSESRDLLLAAREKWLNASTR